MDQNQVIDNQNVDNDLQKAIDNITNPTNIDPVFSDPVAAPSSVPEGDTGELGEPVGPFPEPKPILPTPEPIAPIEPMNIPEINIPAVPNQDLTAMPMPTPSIETPVEEPIMMEPAQEPTELTFEHLESSIQPLSTSEIKKAALRDLIPVLDKINVNSLQKFKIYRNIFEELKDYTVLEPAYEAAREIPDEVTRAEALLYLVEAIDKI